MERSAPFAPSPFVKSFLATTAFALVHSALASRTAKQMAAKRIGLREERGTYRLFYNAQAVLTFGALLVYLRGLPEEKIYETKGPARALLRVGQAASLALFGAALAELKISRVSGFRNAAAWLKGGPIPPGPAAQGPELNPDGKLSTGSAYALTRHPLNAAVTALFWLTPLLNSKRLGFNSASTVYFVLGSFLEEHRLRAAYGEKYDAYRNSGVPFFVPRPTSARLPASAPPEHFRAVERAGP